jgi:hypothetical protein
MNLARGTAKKVARRIAKKVEEVDLESDNNFPLDLSQSALIN